VQHDPARDAGESLARRSHVGIRVAMRATEIVFEDELAAPHDQQSAILRAAVRRR
jgi:hypothetical protein